MAKILSQVSRLPPGLSRRHINLLHVTFQTTTATVTISARRTAVFARTCATFSSKSNEPHDEKDPHKSKPLEPLVICGPSGVGKGTLVNHVLQTLPEHFQLSISHTTRRPRSHEKHGNNIKSVCMIDVQNGSLRSIQGNKQTNKLGHHYFFVNKDDAKIGILEIDIRGAKAVRHHLRNHLHHHHHHHHHSTRHAKEARYVFITATGGDKALIQRLATRGTETPEQIEQRLKTAKQELDFLQQNPDFFDHVFFNDDLEKSKKVCGIVKKWYLI
ncbi:guanylate kinase [Reticulomyxa filosa]|uniref:Guanylate kinase n=1 Tax=Reticulomyxa filosa TaxID=46433 RepID=X6ME79_RETFI|nr:guanylate kinase [Reticulomyxa filosa]|eukprot:ETO11951.1 guanylate kinase [Reticulomyxa filosa]